MELAYVDAGYTGDEPGAAAAAEENAFGGGQVARGQARLCPAASSLGH